MNEKYIIDNDIKEFLKNYLILCLKYNIEISACGCCNSPFILSRKDKLVRFNNIEIEEIQVNYNDRVLEFNLNYEWCKMDLQGNITRR